MYKIFINEYPLIITDNEQDFFRGRNYRMVDNNEKSIQAAIETLENSDRIIGRFGLVIVTDDAEQTFKKLAKKYQRVTAAGGLVYNDAGELLLIKRQGKWDLPKGKKDKGENEAETALREVQEECGIEGLELGDFISHSYHTYFQEGQRMLKTTHWYRMKATSYKNLKPQLEENITEIIWVDPKTLDISELDTYNSIRSLLKSALGQ